MTTVRFWRILTESGLPPSGQLEPFCFAPTSGIRGVDKNSRKQPFQRWRRPPLDAPFGNRATRVRSEEVPRRNRKGSPGPCFGIGG